MKVNVGGEELNLYHNKGSSTTIITPARYRESTDLFITSLKFSSKGS